MRLPQLQEIWTTDYALTFFSFLAKFIGIVFITLGVGAAFLGFVQGIEGIFTMIVFCISGWLGLLVGKGLSQKERFVILIIFVLFSISVFHSISNPAPQNLGVFVTAIFTAIALGFIWKKEDDFKGPWLKPLPAILAIIVAVFWVLVSYLAQ